MSAVTRIETRPGTRLLVCLGDSITLGQLGSNWVGNLKAHHPERTVINAGVNGNLAWNVLQRLDGIIAAQPDELVLLIGSNDNEAMESPRAMAAFRRQQHLPADADASVAWYEQNLTTILDRLSTETRARVALLEIPPFGEDLSSERNERVRTLNASVHRIADEHEARVLPLYERLAAMLPTGRPAPRHSPTVTSMVMAAIRHYGLRQSWNKISAAHGLTLLVEGVHLNDRAGAVVLDLVEHFLDEVNDAAD